MPLSPHLRERLIRQIDALSDERAYQALDYLEFITSKYGAREPVSAANIFTRFTDGVEDTLRAGKVSATAISETMGLLNKAAGVLSGVAAAGKSVATDFVAAATTTVSAPPSATDASVVAPPVSPGDAANKPPAAP